MDCRHLFALPLGLSLLVCGCVTSQTRPAPAPAATTPPVHLIQKDTPTAKRALKPDTVVSLAAFRESEATDTKEGPAKQRQLRDEARQSYQEALRLDPNCLAAYQGLGRVYTELNDWQRAMEAYRTGLEKHPRDPALWFGQGVCLCRQKNFAQAAESLRKALQLNPENRQ